MPIFYNKRGLDMELLLIPINFLLLLMILILCILLSKWLRAPIILLFIGAGLFIGTLKYNGEPLFYFPEFMLASVAIFALSFLMFYSFSKLRFNEFDTLTKRSLRLSALIMALNLVIISTSVFLIFNFSPVFSVVLGLLVSATSFDIIFPELGKKHNRMTRLLEAESIISTPVISIISVIILIAALNWSASLSANSYMNLLKNFGFFSVPSFMDGVLYIFKELFISAAIGLIIGLIAIGIMKKKFLRITSPIFLMTAVVASYIVAEMFFGIGIVAAAVFGILYGHSLVKEKVFISQVSSKFAYVCVVFGFMLIAAMFEIKEGDGLTGSFIVSSLFIFALILLVRLVSVFICFSKKDYTVKERIFLSLNAPFGISAVLVLFAAIILFSQLNPSAAFILLDEKSQFISLIIALVAYSLIFSFAISRLSGHFINLENLDNHRFFDSSGSVKSRNKGAKK
jgi:NhaP-type Na+/H+ or K+/H+ antiporter